jgi:hypothetical protein
MVIEQGTRLYNEPQIMTIEAYDGEPTGLVLCQLAHGAQVQYQAHYVVTGEIYQEEVHNGD